MIDLILAAAPNGVRPRDIPGYHHNKNKVLRTFEKLTKEGKLCFRLLPSQVKIYFDSAESRALYFKSDKHLNYQNDLTRLPANTQVVVPKEIKVSVGPSFDYQRLAKVECGYVRSYG